MHQLASLIITPYHPTTFTTTSATTRPNILTDKKHTMTNAQGHPVLGFICIETQYLMNTLYVAAYRSTDDAKKRACHNDDDNTHKIRLINHLLIIHLESL